MESRLSVLQVLLVLLLCSSTLATDMSFKQTASKWTDGYIWSMETPVDQDLTDPQFNIHTPIAGSSIVPDNMVVVTWDNIAPRLLPATTTYSFPADVRIELFTEDLLVSVLCHSAANIGQFQWVVRLPRGWSNDFWYHLRIYSVQDPHVFSRSSEFRITMPYGFYP